MDGSNVYRYCKLYQLSEKMDLKRYLGFIVEYQSIMVDRIFKHSGIGLIKMML